MSANISTWSVRHPVGVVALTLAVMVLGGVSLTRLNIDLLPSIIYPDIQVRVLDPGVPAEVMENEVTRELEEQLAITEGVIAIQSRTTEGRSAIDLSFRYGEDIDQALRDASSRLDRAKRFLPDTDDPPIIFKRDPFQLPVAEYVVSSTLRDPVELRTWTDYTLGRSLVTLPGVASVEIGGGLEREVQVVASQFRLAGLGIDILDLETRLRTANQDVAAGRLRMPDGEIGGRTEGRFRNVQEIIDLPLKPEAGDNPMAQMRIGEIAQVIDGSSEERLRIRLDDQPGIKLAIQKQPLTNTVAVVDTVDRELARLKAQGQLPEDIQIQLVDDQARYIRHSLENAVNAALGGALLAMAVVYIFLGSLRRTLIIGAAIPIAVLVTFILMAANGLTFNIMTLGGLALGIGMLVDSTIVMLENIYRHQRMGQTTLVAADAASREVTGAIIASTSTNLAAVLPFLFIGGLVGLLFQELIFTISAAILASMVVALTLVPALAGRVPASREGMLRIQVNRVMEALQNGYARLLDWLLRIRWLVILAFIGALAWAVPWLIEAKQEFLPALDEGDVRITLTADAGIDLEEMDRLTRRIEALVAEQPEVEAIFTTVGGFVFGRSSFESANRASLQVLLIPAAERDVGSKGWITRVSGLIRALEIPGLRASLVTRGIRGIRFNQGDDDVSLRIAGENLDTLAELADRVVEQLVAVEGLGNVQHSSQDITREISIRLDPQRAASFGLTIEDIGTLLRFALEGRIVTELIDGDRSVDLLLRLDRMDIAAPGDLDSIVLFSKTEPRRPLRLGDVATVEILAQPATILRDRQQRTVEITASVGETLTLQEAIESALTAAARVPLPAGYRLYEAGGLETLKQGQDMSRILLGLALFLVLVAMAVQYESVRNPVIILISVPFALIGVVLGLQWTGLPVSMPVWLGLIMLAGIVVNNAIVLVEFIEIERRAGLDARTAILEAARLRLRPILMTTLTTVVGMLPLALALGEGSEMLQPLAVTIVAGLSFSTLVSLVLVPLVYRVLAARTTTQTPTDPADLGLKASR
ncbi:efflux RND transporter permease subunit [Thiocapsa sp. UBA6158]|jgi:CzcA family heavy metal efflux pump|uniref:efflux RND transporter permease subunit n=1 Tax=Thiocapsa sp. UBA6158 TaxID=1947692 RepID=UPI0025D942E7|nr:efflux RND transporter permease subunit [Thiocapsa sp. UBA6158]